MLFSPRKTLAGSGETLGNEVDLNKLHIHLLEVDNEANHLARDSSWLCSPGRLSSLEAEKNYPGERGIIQ